VYSLLAAIFLAEEMGEELGGG